MASVETTLLRQLSRILAALALLPGFACADQWLVLTGATLFDGTGGPVIEDASLVIHEGVIESAAQGQPAFVSEPGDVVTRIELDGAFVMPGLIDTHVHVARFPDTRVHAERLLREALRGGVTAVRDLGGDARALADIQRAAAAGELLVPTVVFGALYGGKGLFEDRRLAGFVAGYEPGGAPWARRVAADADLPLAVAETRGAGASALKLYGNLDKRLAGNLIAEAHGQGLQAWAHATVFPARPGDLVAAGVDTLSHATYLVWEAAETVPDDYGARTAGDWAETPTDHPKLLDLYERMAADGVLLDATVTVYRRMKAMVPDAEWADEAFAWGVEVTAAAQDNGVPITVGTDWFMPESGRGLPHTHDELAVLVEEVGLSPAEALVAATRNGAKAMGVLDERGTLELGKAADLLVLEASPLDDIRNTAKIRLVIKDGQLVDR